jgi:hypothetical protein
MKKTILISALFLTALYLSSCMGSLTEISGTWTKPGYKGKKFNKILVVAISNELVKRNAVESAMAKELASVKINATTSTSVLDLSSIEKTKDGKIDTTKIEAVKKSLIDAGYDGAIVLSLLDKKEKTEYVPGQTYYQPNYYHSYGYGPYSYNGFYNYSYSTYNVVNTPGYYVEKTNFYIESRLFDLKSDEMLWAAQSETLNPSNLKDFSSSLAKAVVDNIVNDFVIR